MLNLLKDKKVIFFDVGYTLDAPASGDWMFTNKFLELAGEKLKQRTAQMFSRPGMPGCTFWNRLI